MSFIATVEIPKGSDRRTHMAYDKSGFIDLGPMKERIPVNNGVMPVHYGFIEGTFNPVENDEVDVLVFSNLQYQSGNKVEIEILGMLEREDGDNKVIARDNTVTDAVFYSLPEQERSTVLAFMGCRSPISAIASREETIEFLKKSTKSPSRIEMSQKEVYSV